MQRQMYDLAKLYTATGEADAGRRAIFILNAYADRFPTWVYNADYGHRYADDLRPDRLHGWGVMTREGRRPNDEQNGPANFLEVADLMLCTKAFADFEANLTGPTRLKDKIWDNVIRLAMLRSAENWEYKTAKVREFGQFCPTNFVHLGRIFHRPELIRSSIFALDFTPRICMGVDGSFVQGTGYGQIHLRAMLQMRLANGYSDPPWYVIPNGEAVYKDYRYPYGEHETFWMKAYNWLARVRMPDGGVPVRNAI